MEISGVWSQDSLGVLVSDRACKGFVLPRQFHPSGTPPLSPRSRSNIPSLFLYRYNAELSSAPFSQRAVGKRTQCRCCDALCVPAVLVLTLFVVYLSVAIWGCCRVREGLDKRRLAREDSYSTEAFNVEYKYFRDHPWRVQVRPPGLLN